MTRTIDVTGLPETVMSPPQNPGQEAGQRTHHPLYIKDATPEERIARLLALVAEFADNDAVLEDDRREVLYADQPKC